MDFVLTIKTQSHLLARIDKKNREMWFFFPTLEKYVEFTFTGLQPLYSRISCENSLWFLWSRYDWTGTDGLFLSGSATHTNVQTHSSHSISAHSCVSRDYWRSASVCGAVEAAAAE